MVAFHFEFSNQAGWKCDICRKSGLEERRRCGWLDEERESATGGAGPGGTPDRVRPTLDAPGRLVWARRNVTLDTCPKAYITAESQTLVEEFFVRRRLRMFDGVGLSARKAEAFVILEKELAEEINNGRHNARHIG